MPGLETNTYQNQIADRLRIHYGDDVKKEWCVSAGATDAFRNRAIYAPRVDIAVGPFNTTLDQLPANRHAIRQRAHMSQLFHQLVARQPRIDMNQLNENPRCFLAIELSFSGSAKHIMGDFANASLMGLVGVVVAGPRNHSKVVRMANYLRLVSEVGKAPSGLFRNLAVFEVNEFVNFLANGQPEN